MGCTFPTRCKRLGGALRKGNYPIFLQGTGDFSGVRRVQPTAHFRALCTPGSFYSESSGKGEQTRNKASPHCFLGSNIINMSERIQQVKWNSKPVFLSPFYRAK